MDNMTILQALDYARSQNVILPAEFYLLDLNSRQHASTVSGLASLNQIKTVLNSVYNVVESGGTFQDFQKMIETDGIDLPEAQLKMCSGPIHKMPMGMVVGCINSAIKVNALI